MDIPLLLILSRWIHVTTACVVVGAIFFMRIILPLGLQQLDDPAAAQRVFLRCRRALKILVHTSILLFLASGAFNAVVLWPQYSLQRGLLHGVFGIHLLLGLVIFTIALVVLARPEPPKTHRKWMAVNLVLLLVTIAVASTLKYMREQAAIAANRPAGPAVTIVDQQGGER